MINKFNNKFRISSTRLPHWDYSSEGYYFVTICTKNKESILGEVKNRRMVLSEIGIIADKYWLEIPKHFPFVDLDIFQVMPNHIHGIVIIVETQNIASLHKNKTINKFGPQSNNLGSIIRGFKSGVTTYSRINNIPFSCQSNYYEHIIRNDNELMEIREYIENNPLKWELDEENPKKITVKL